MRFLLSHDSANYMSNQSNYCRAVWQFQCHVEHAEEYLNRLYSYVAKKGGWDAGLEKLREHGRSMKDVWVYISIVGVKPIKGSYLGATANAAELSLQDVDGERRERDLLFQGMDGDRGESGEEREGSGERAERSEKEVGSSSIRILRRGETLGGSTIRILRVWEALGGSTIYTYFTCLGGPGRLNWSY